MSQLSEAQIESFSTVLNAIDSCSKLCDLIYPEFHKCQALKGGFKTTFRLEMQDALWRIFLSGKVHVNPLEAQAYAAIAFGDAGGTSAWLPFWLAYLERNPNPEPSFTFAACAEIDKRLFVKTFLTVELFLNEIAEVDGPINLAEAATIARILTVLKSLT